MNDDESDFDFIDGEVLDGATPVAAAEPADVPKVEYEIRILSLAYNVEHTQVTIEFEAVGAPNFSYSKVANPILRAVVPLVVDVNRRLSAGSRDYSGGVALTIGETKAYTFFEAMEPPKAHGVPTQPPSDEQITSACLKALRRHIAEALNENERVAFREKQESLVGRTFKVRT